MKQTMKVFRQSLHKVLALDQKVSNINYARAFTVIEVSSGRENLPCWSPHLTLCEVSSDERHRIVTKSKDRSINFIINSAFGC